MLPPGGRRLNVRDLGRVPWDGCATIQKKMTKRSRHGEPLPTVSTAFALNAGCSGKKQPDTLNEPYVLLRIKTTCKPLHANRMSLLIELP